MQTTKDPNFWTNYPPVPIPSPGVPSTLFVDLFNNQSNIQGNKAWANTAAQPGTIQTITPANYLALPASTENIDILHDLSHTVQFATGAVALQRFEVIKAPTISAVGASVFANVVTFAVEAAPIVGANATFTKSYIATFGPIANTTSGQYAGGMLGAFGSGVTGWVIRNTSNSVEAFLNANTSTFNFGTSTNHAFQLFTNNAVRATIGSTGKWTLTPAASTSGVTPDWVLTPAPDTGITASTARPTFRIDTATKTWATTGTVAAQHDYEFNGLTYASASASQTFTNAATLYASSPIAGANAVITNGYAAWFQANAIAGTSEKVVLVNGSDDTVSKFEILNDSTSDGVFRSALNSVSSGSGVALIAYGRITTDSGTNPAFSYDGRVGTSTSLATRPHTNWFNNGLSIQQLSAAGGLTISGGTAPSLTVGASGTPTKQIKEYSQTITPGAVGALGVTGTVQTFTVTGLTTADTININEGASQTAGVGRSSARCSAADTLEVTFYNTTAGGLTPVASIWLITATRF